MAHYAAISRQIREIFFRYTPLVEPLALDEAFLDVTGCEGLFGTADRIGHRIKQEIKEETGLVASVGVAPNKFLAKIARTLKSPMRSSSSIQLAYKRFSIRCRSVACGASAK